jgi:energy-coupling factor transporter ATP-binding protein EcfA2
LSIKLNNFSWKYKDAKDWTLKDINLEVKSGEIIGIMGRSGAGKTTLALTLNGLVPQTIAGEIKGTVEVTGMDTQTTPVKELVKNVGMVFQDPETQFVTMLVEDELTFGLENMAVPREEIGKRLAWVSEMLRIKEILKSHPYELSGGQKQRVAIASALVLNPKILVLDEPTSDLDPVGKSEIFSITKELSERGITMFIVEHEAEDLAKVADRIILIENGRVVLEDEPSLFYNNVDRLHEAGVSPPQVTEFYKAIGEGHQVSNTAPLTVEDCYPIVSDILGNKARNTVKDPHKTQKTQDKKVSENKIIEAKNIEYVYQGGRKALVGVDLTIHEGEFVGLVGQNGSGKTTIAKVIANILKPTNGQVLLDGIDTKNLTQAQTASKIAYSFQNPDHQLVCNTVEEEIKFAPKNIGIAPEEVEKIAEDLLNKVGLSEYKNEHPIFLGKGQRKVLAVASVLSMRPKVLIVDEPTTGQDWQSTKSIMELLRTLNKEGRTIIIITHNMDVVAENCNRVVIMNKGRIALDGPPGEVFAKGNVLNDLFLKPPMITRLAQRCADLGFPPSILTVDEMCEVLRDIQT